MADKSEDFTGLLNSIDEITELIYVSAENVIRREKHSLLMRLPAENVIRFSKSVILPAHFVQIKCYIPIKVMAGNLQTRLQAGIIF